MSLPTVTPSRSNHVLSTLPPTPDPLTPTHTPLTPHSHPTHACSSLPPHPLMFQMHPLPSQSPPQLPFTFLALTIRAFMSRYCCFLVAHSSSPTPHLTSCLASHVHIYIVSPVLRLTQRLPTSKL